MSQANGNPDEIECFAATLNSYVENLREETSRLMGAFSVLSETWQDEKRNAFEESLTQLQAQLSQFENECEEQIPYLNLMAARLRDYLQC